MFDLIMDYSECFNFVEEYGMDAFLEKLNDLFPNRKLYTFTTAWLEDRNYICKARGLHGDVLIGCR